MKKIFNYYTTAFENSFNYSDPGDRCELNYFLLIFFILYLIVFFILIFITSTKIATNQANAISNILFFPICILGFMLIHLFPFLALIKRRLNKLHPQKSKLFFTIFLIVFGINALIPISLSLYFTLNAQMINQVNFVYLIPIIFLSQICGLASIGSTIYLMVKK